MKSLVLDSSISLSFVLVDEHEPLALKALAHIDAGGISLVPGHWWLEVANGLLAAERRRRSSAAEIAEALELVRSLPVATDQDTAARACRETAALARRHRLSLYDAAYLDLAMKTGSALGTLDRALGQAAIDSGISLFGA